MISQGTSFWNLGVFLLWLYTHLAQLPTDYQGPQWVPSFISLQHLFSILTSLPASRFPSLQYILNSTSKLIFWNLQFIQSPCLLRLFPNIQRINPNTIYWEENHLPAHLKQSSALVKLLNILASLSSPKQHPINLDNLFTDFSSITSSVSSSWSLPWECQASGIFSSSDFLKVIPSISHLLSS